MNVCLVSRGEYSDFHIEAVFSRREAADRYVAVRKECDTYDIGYHIHEHEVDAAGKVGAVAIATYSATINLSTGMIEDLEQDCEEVGPPSARGRVHSPELHYDARGELLGNSPGHARKLAVEARQKWLMKEALAFEQKLDGTLPTLHKALEDNRRRILQKVVQLMIASDKPWAELGRAGEIATGVLAPDFEAAFGTTLLGAISSGEVARLIGGCPIGWEAPAYA